MEIKLHEKLDHPNIVNLLKTIIFGEEEEGILMIMEHMKGGSLNTLSKKIQKEGMWRHYIYIYIYDRGQRE